MADQDDDLELLDEEQPKPKDEDKEQPRSIGGALPLPERQASEAALPLAPSITGASAMPAPIPKSVTAGPLGGNQPILPPSPAQQMPLAQTTTASPLAPRPAFSALQNMEQQGSPLSHKHGIGGGILKALDVAGTILAPGAMQAIPGTNANFSLRERNAKRAADEEGKEIQEQTAERTAQSESELRGAETKNFQSETTARENPPPMWKAIGDPFIYNGNAYQPRINEKTGETELTTLQVPGTTGPLTGTFSKIGATEQNQPIGQTGAAQHAQELQTLVEGMTPQEKQSFLAAYSAQPTDTNAIASKRLEDAKASAQMSGAERDRKIARDAQAQNRAQVESDKRDAATRSEVDKAHATIGKALDKADDQLEKLKTATSTIGSATEIGDALGIVKTLVAAAGGQGSGVRVTMPEITRIAEARGWTGGVEAFFEHAAGYGTLNPQQRQQIKDILGDITKVVQARRDRLASVDDRILNATSVDEVRAAQKEMTKPVSEQGGGSQYKYNFSGKKGNIHSNDGKNWVDDNGNPIGG